MPEFANMTGSGGVGGIATAPPGAINWHFDDTEIHLIGHSLEMRKHRGEHHVAEYKGHKLRILRCVVPVDPANPKGESRYEWQGECDGEEFGEPGTHSNAIAAALQAHVDALPTS